MEVVIEEHVTVTDASSVGEVRRKALFVAQRLDFNETRSGEFALLATEASRNVHLHGGGGHVVVQGVRANGEMSGRILAIDKGQGIANVAQAMSDGYSTAGTMGGGMGAMKRIATGMDIFTGRAGTIVWLQLGSLSDPGPFRVAGISAPYPGERVCGDAWAFHRDPDRILVLVVDGLGHGWEAAEAAQEAVGVFKKRTHNGPGEIINYVHEALRKTRGAVAAVAEIRRDEGTIVYAGIGNISAVVLGDSGSRSLASHNGTLGVTVSRVQEFKYDWPAKGTLVMHSDGLQSRWDILPYPGLISRDPALIMGVLMRDFRRHRDDATVVVVKST